MRFFDSVDLINRVTQLRSLYDFVVIESDTQSDCTIANFVGNSPIQVECKHCEYYLVGSHSYMICGFSVI